MKRTMWRDTLLTGFAPFASTEYASAVRHGQRGLPPLPPFAAKYLELIELSLTGSLLPEAARGECHPERRPQSPPPRGKAGTCYAVNQGPFVAHRRLVGRDWPTHGVTMVGHARLHNLRHCLQRAIAENVSGDFVELGVWRGGASIYARAVLEVYEQRERSVRLFDAFGRIPGYGAASEFLAVTLPEVRDNFAAYGLHDGVEFNAGLFNETLPRFYHKHKGDRFARIAVLRIDGNFYESYQDALYYLWEFVPVGGFVIFDDYTEGGKGAPWLGQFWDEFKRAHGLREKLLTVDWTSSFFQKEKDVRVNWGAYARDRARMRGFAPVTDAVPRKRGTKSRH
jgi:hypothetical protein